VIEEVSKHIISNTTTFKALQKLKDLYDSHPELGIIQLLMKLFNLELKDNNPMKLASESKSLFNDIDSIGVKVDLKLIAFIKSLYPTYSHYLESLQASGQMKAVTFDTLVDKIAKREKAFGKKESFSTSTVETLCLAQKEQKLRGESTRFDNSNKGRGRRPFRGRGGHYHQGDTQQHDRRQKHFQNDKQSLKCYRCGKLGHTSSHCHTPWERISEKKEKQPPDKGKPPESTHYIVAHCNLSINEVFSTSFASWEDTWILDTGVTFHMTFRRDFFETFSNHFDGIVYFADKSQLNPSGIGSIRLRLLGIVDYILHDVLYIPQLKRNLMSLIHIRQQGNSIHMFDGIIEIRKAYDQVIVMTGVEEDKLLKLKGTSSFQSTLALLAQHSDTLSSSFLWHARFGYINYDSIQIMKHQGIQGLPTIPRNLSPCNACILGKHCKQPFYGSTSRASRKLGLIHSDLCGPMLVQFANSNKYPLTFIDDYTRMCWVYLLKEKS
jgi:hypothetical protein